jgi:hypothetical protein
LILVEADYVAMNDEQAAAFVAALNEAREGKADLQWGETTY